MRGSQTTFKSASRSNPCPVCEGVDGCSIGADGLFLCRRREGPQAGFIYLGRAKGDSQWAQFRREGDPLLNEPDDRAASNGHQNRAETADRHAQTNGPRTEEWRSRAEGFEAALTPALRRELAEALGLPETALDA